MKKYLPEVLAVLMFGAAILALIYQHYILGWDWFDMGQGKSWESAALVLIAGGVGILVGKYLGKV